MECGYARFTVFFEDPFWVGVYEREDGERLEACKLTFGAEPRDCEVWAWLLGYWRELEFSPGVPVGGRPKEGGSPKRARRQAKEALRPGGVGTKAQQALQLQYQQNKQACRQARRERDAAEEEHRFRLRQEKKKEKRRGH